MERQSVLLLVKRREAKKSQQIVANFWPLVGFAVLLITWEVWAHLYQHPALVPPSIVLPTLARLLVSGEMWPHVAQSLKHVLTGFLLAVTSGFGVGVLMVLSDRFKQAALPVVDAVRGVSAISMFPLIILLLGLGLASKAFIIFWTAWPAVLLTTVSGIEQVDDSLIEAATLDTASRWKITERICIPLALPVILTGLRVALSGGWISLTAAEMLGGNSGLGYFVLQSSQTFHFPEMYAGILTIALTGYTLNVLFNRLQKISEERTS